MTENNEAIEKNEEPALEPILDNPAPIESESLTPPKPRRGRPPKNPGPLPEQKVGETTAKKPGRPKSRATLDDAQIANMARQIQGLHMIAAQATGLPELGITEKESTMLAHSIALVSAEYGLSMSGKTGAMLQLIGTAAIVYLPRMGAINQKIKQRQAEKRAQTIVEMPT
jgi:hypothetical protein